MKTLAYVFISIGMVCNFFINIYIGIIGLGIGIWALITLSESKKNTACGVLTILLSSLLGGIFYLCWKGE